MTVDDLLASGTAPVVAILRGVAPDAVLAIGDALVEAGIRLIEVPFNSPDPTTSIRMLQDRLGDSAAVVGECAHTRRGLAGGTDRVMRCRALVAAAELGNQIT